MNGSWVGGNSKTLFPCTKAQHVVPKVPSSLQPDVNTKGCSHPPQPGSGMEWRGLCCSKGGSSNISGCFARLPVLLPMPLANVIMRVLEAW